MAHASACGRERSADSHFLRMLACANHIDSGRQLYFRTAAGFYGNVAHHCACNGKNCDINTLVCRIIDSYNGTLHLNRGAAFNWQWFCRDRSAKSYACAYCKAQCQRENICGYFFHGGVLCFSFHKDNDFYPYIQIFWQIISPIYVR